MKMKTILDDVKASIPVGHDLAEHMINYYFTYYYKGRENHHVIERFYATMLYFELKAQLAKCEKNELVEKMKNGFNFRKEVLKQKSRTYKNRVRCLTEWEKYVTLGTRSKDETVELMIKLYPKIEGKKDVAIELGVDKTIKELTNEYHRSL